jgi:GNAT superfamily N-acetyltransferase
MPQRVLDALSLETRVEQWARSLRNPVFDIFVGGDGRPATSAVAGLAMASASTDRPDTGEVNAIYALQRVYGTGLGTALLRRVVDAMRARGFATGTLDVLETNARARSFYEREGWRVVDLGANEVGGVPVPTARYELDLDPGFTVREARPGVERAIAEVHEASWRAAYEGVVPQDALESRPSSISSRLGPWRARLQRAIRGEVGVWVAVAGERVVGACDLTPTRGDADASRSRFELRTLYVSPDWWRRGVGSVLMERVRQWLREREEPRVILWVLEANEGARCFYYGLGWRPDGALDERFRTFEAPALRYVLELD